MWSRFAPSNRGSGRTLEKWIRPILHTRRYEAGRRTRQATISKPSGVSHRHPSQSKFSRFSIQDNAKTLSLICTPPCNGVTKIRIILRKPKSDQIIISAGHKENHREPFFPVVNRRILPVSRQRQEYRPLPGANWAVEAQNRGVEVECRHENQGEAYLLHKSHIEPRKFLSISKLRGENQAPWFDIPRKTVIWREKVSNHFLQWNAKPYLSGNQALTGKQKWERL